MGSVRYVLCVMCHDKRKENVSYNDCSDRYCKIEQTINLLKVTV